MFKESRSCIKNRLVELRAERGATDPILVIAAIAVSLVLLVGGSFAVSGIIANGHNLNAKADLDKLAVAQTAYYAEHDGFSGYDKDDADSRALEDSGVGFHPTDKGDLLVVLIEPSADYTNGAWAAISKSAASDSGPFFIRTSERNATGEVARNGSTLDLGDSAPGEPSEGERVAADLADLGITVTALLTAAG